MPNTRMRIARALCLLVLPVVAASAPSAATTPPEPATPILIERGVERGDLDRAAADLLLVAAIRGKPVPAAYESETPFRATLPLLELHARLDSLAPGPERRSLRAALHPTGPFGTDACDLSNTALPNTIESTHFYIEYSAAALGGGMTIDDYVAALETSWVKEVDQFGWAAPPSLTSNPAPSNKYPVRIDPTLGPTIYGFVSSSGTHAGPVGNNPATSWNEGDARATCMVLNSNYDPFPGDPIDALQSTAAHEFNHSIQFGIGGLDGRVPDYVFIEGGATWMEDEVFDDSNDNYNYLWPVFDDDMGEYKDNLPIEPYEYWITWRGITEPFGTGIVGGGEDVMQRFWELTSKNQLEDLEALDSSLEAEGTTLPAAYHSYAIAVKFNKPCGGGYQSPHCLEEGPAYVAAKGPNLSHGSVAMNATFSRGLFDNYALNWIDLPANIDLQAVLKNTSGGGRFRASLACDTGTGLVVAPFTSVVGGGEMTFVRSWDAATCATPIAVVTNVTQTQASPSTSNMRGYSLMVTPPAEKTRMSVKGRASASRVLASGRLRPSSAGVKIEVTLFERAGGWQEVKSRKVGAVGGGKFAARFPLPDAQKCRIEAEFAGNIPLLPSSDKATFRC
ncbi:MAG: hypothetical protein ACRDH9_02565 [Actinomycetota bacterium]